MSSSSPAINKLRRLGPVYTGEKSRKDVRHSGDENHPLSTKSTELNMFNFGDNVDRDKSATKSKADFVDCDDFRLCRRCVLALSRLSMSSCSSLPCVSSDTFVVTNEMYSDSYVAAC